MTELIAACWVLSLVAAGYGGYKYGHGVASKIAADQAKLQKAAKDLQ